MPNVSQWPFHRQILITSAKWRFVPNLKPPKRVPEMFTEMLHTYGPPKNKARVFCAHFLCVYHHLLSPPIAHLLKWLSKVPTSSPMRLSLAGTMPCRHTTRSLLSLVWNTTSWSFPGDTLTPVTWDGAREGDDTQLNTNQHVHRAHRETQTCKNAGMCVEKHIT